MVADGFDVDEETRRPLILILGDVRWWVTPEYASVLERGRVQRVCSSCTERRRRGLDGCFGYGWKGKTTRC